VPDQDDGTAAAVDGVAAMETQEDDAGVGGASAAGAGMCWLLYGTCI